LQLCRQRQALSTMRVLCIGMVVWLRAGCVLRCVGVQPNKALAAMRARPQARATAQIARHKLGAAHDAVHVVARGAICGPGSFASSALLLLPVHSSTLIEAALDACARVLCPAGRLRAFTVLTHGTRTRRAGSSSTSGTPSAHCCSSRSAATASASVLHVIAACCSGVNPASRARQQR
jgi:hypothetical protein